MALGVSVAQVYAFAWIRVRLPGAPLTRMADTNNKDTGRHSAIQPATRQELNMSKEQLIYEIFVTLAEEAMNRGYDVRLRYDNSNREAKTIVSNSKSDGNSLEMNMWRPDPSEEYENGFEDGYDEGCMDLIDEELETD